MSSVSRVINTRHSSDGLHVKMEENSQQLPPRSSLTDNWTERSGEFIYSSADFDDLKSSIRSDDNKSGLKRINVQDDCLHSYTSTDSDLPNLNITRPANTGSCPLFGNASNGKGDIDFLEAADVLGRALEMRLKRNSQC
ncbi:unnamed protein product [Schistocephalus solidus]|uniref:Ovule protein n=1 Tax=Schistocephalus solidus TaxID=70667 RepID=A0A183SHJ9_SCHSO|nr:unnamed protein product [Schistocephalus solidus]